MLQFRSFHEELWQNKKYKNESDRKFKIKIRWSDPEQEHCGRCFNVTDVAHCSVKEFLKRLVFP
jgi:hypothetical protein